MSSASDKTKKRKDRHTSGFMVRLPSEYRDMVRHLTGKSRRSITTEIQIAIEKHFKGEFPQGVPADE